MRELLKLGVEVHVALPSNGPLIVDYKREGVVVHFLQTDFPIRKPWLLPKQLKELRALVFRIQPDLIHSHFVGTTLTMRLALGKNSQIPRLFQVPGPLHLEHLFFRQAELLTAGLRDYWVGSCKWTCDRYLKSGISKDHLFLSYYGIDLKQFSSSEPSGKLRNELGLGNDTPLIGMVAYMYPPKRHLGQNRGLKGHEDLIDALAMCQKSIPNLKAVFIGGAWGNASAYEQKVRDYAQTRLGDKAIFLGTRNDVAELYPDLDVAVHPSHSENLGGACESMLMGVPTIATCVGGFPDVVIPRKTGWLVPPGDPKSLSTSILESFRNPALAKRMSDHGQRMIRRLIDVKKTSYEVFSIYESILSRN